MSVCINPDLIQEGDLQSFVDGDASDEVRAHVERCQACMHEVKLLRSTSQQLAHWFFRSACPASEQLGRYQLDLLTPQERLAISAHTRTCEHCTAELAALKQLDDSLLNAVMQTIKNTVQVVSAVLVPPEQPHLAQARGPGGSQMTYRSENLDVLVGFQPDMDRHHHTLIGSIVQADVVQGKNIHLFVEGEKPRSTQVDTLGTFFFEGIQIGSHALAIELEESVVLLREIKIDAS